MTFNFIYKLWYYVALPTLQNLFLFFSHSLQLSIFNKNKKKTFPEIRIPRKAIKDIKNNVTASSRKGNNYKSFQIFETIHSAIIATKERHELSIQWTIWKLLTEFSTFCQHTAVYDYPFQGYWFLTDLLQFLLQSNSIRRWDRAQIDC